MDVSPPSHVRIGFIVLDEPHLIGCSDERTKHAGKRRIRIPRASPAGSGNAPHRRRLVRRRILPRQKSRRGGGPCRSPCSTSHDGLERRPRPSAAFSTAQYLIYNPDIRAAGIDPLEHYVASGKAEGRLARYDLDFDRAYYLARNPDVAAAGIDPFQHYMQVGWKEGRDPSALFNTKYYLSRNPDIAAAGINPLLHFETTGWKEGRDPSAGFSTRQYLQFNPDLPAGADPLAQYIASGAAAGACAATMPISTGPTIFPITPTSRPQA